MPARKTTRPKAKMPPNAPQAGPIVWMDPNDLLIDPARNTRGDGEPDAGLIASVKEFAVLEPIIAVTTPKGPLVRFGERRTRASIIAGWYVPVWMVGDDDTAGQAEAERIFAQLSENRDRAPVTAADEARAIVTLFDLGVKPDVISQRARRPREVVEAARAAAASARAAELAAAKPQVTLDHMVGLAEFDGDQAAQDDLVASIDNGQFEHRMQVHRNNVIRAATRQAAHDKLVAAGVKVTDEPADGWRLNVRYYLDNDGVPFTPESHATCPGHAAYLQAGYAAKPDSEPAANYYCTEARRLHRPTSSDEKGKPQRAPDELTAERRMIRANNDLWRAAAEVRRRFVRELAQRADPPRGAAEFIFGSLLRCDHALLAAMQREWAQCKDLAGWDPVKTRTADMVAAISGRPVPRFTVAVLGLVAAAHEAMLTEQAWRKPAAHKEEGRYLRALAMWGYSLSPLERTVAEATAPPLVAEDGISAAVAAFAGCDELDRMVARFTEANPSFTGAAADDILEHLADYDADLDIVDPFFAKHPGELAHPSAVHIVRILLWGRPGGTDRADAVTLDKVTAVLDATTRQAGEPGA